MQFCSQFLTKRSEIFSRYVFDADHLNGVVSFFILLRYHLPLVIS